MRFHQLVVLWTDAGAAVAGQSTERSCAASAIHLKQNLYTSNSSAQPYVAVHCTSVSWCCEQFGPAVRNGVRRLLRQERVSWRQTRGRWCQRGQPQRVPPVRPGQCRAAAQGQLVRGSPLRQRHLGSVSPNAASAVARARAVAGAAARRSAAVSEWHRGLDRLALRPSWPP
jgi:hypothetical protein